MFTSATGTHTRRPLARAPGPALPVPAGPVVERQGASLSPQLFVGTYHRFDPGGATLVLTPGEAVVLDGNGLVT
ncbi:MAG: hypothetical protein ACLQVK_00685 [Acidimicrobiales bacterium]|jgi:hypothetical protein